MKIVLSKTNQNNFGKLLFLLNICALINVFCYSNVQVENLCKIAFASILFFIALYWHLLSKKLFFWIFFLCYLSIFFTIAEHGGEAIAINFFNVLLATLVFGNLKISLITFRRIHLVTAIFLSFYVLTMEYENISLIHMYSFLGDRVNRNSLGFLILACFYSWICFLETYKKHTILRWICEIVISGICANLINLAGCRTAIGAMAVFIFLVVVKKATFTYEQFRLIIIIVMVLSIAIIPIYIIYAEKNISIMLLGKNLFSGREYVWKSAFEYFLRSPLIGHGAEVAFAGPNRTINVSAHNTILNIICTLGIIPAASFVFMLGRRLVSTREYPYNRIAQLAFLSSLLLLFFESFYVDSHFVIFYLMLLFPVESEQERRKIT